MTDQKYREFFIHKEGISGQDLYCRFIHGFPIDKDKKLHVIEHRAVEDLRKELALQQQITLDTLNERDFILELARGMADAMKYIKEEIMLPHQFDRVDLDVKANCVYTEANKSLKKFLEWEKKSE